MAGSTTNKNGLFLVKEKKFLQFYNNMISNQRKIFFISLVPKLLIPEMDSDQMTTINQGAILDQNVLFTSKT